MEKWIGETERAPGDPGSFARHPVFGERSQWQQVRSAYRETQRGDLVVIERWHDFPDGSLIVETFPASVRPAVYVSPKTAARLKIDANWWWFDPSPFRGD